MSRIFGKDYREIISGAPPFNINQRAEEISNVNTKSSLEQIQFLLTGRS
jgi:hypothetical protein